MKINFSQALFDFRTGERMTREVNGSAASPLTLGFCCSEALVMPDGEKGNPDRKVSDLILAMKVFAGDEVEITPEEASRLKEKIAAAYPSALVAGQCCQMLNG
jgi:hypothetical protein